MIVPTSVLSAMVALSPSILSLDALLVSTIAALDTFSSTLRCSGTSTTCSTSGSTSSPCSGGSPCTPATRFCMSNGITPCTQDSDCSSSTCPYNGTVFTSATTALNAYGVASSGADQVTSSLSPVVAAMRLSTRALLDVPSFPSFSAKLSSVQSSLAAVPISSSLSATSTLRSQLDPGTLNLADTQSSIRSSKSTFNSATTSIAGVRTQLVTFNNSLSSVKDQVSSLGKRFTTFCSTIDTYFSTTVCIPPPTAHKHTR